MQDRADITAAAMAVACFVVSAAYALLVPGAVSSAGPSFPLYLILSVPTFSYAAYWAFGIRHALAVPLFRRQAFGIGFLVLAFWLTIAAFVLVPVADSPLTSGVQFGAFYLLFIVLFYWIDASVLAARRSDPLLRDTLRWSKVRIPLWAALVLSVIVPFAVMAYVGLLDPAAASQLNAGTFGGPVVSFVLNLLFNLPVIVPICGIICFPVIALRSKWDRSLRRHFLWFAPVALAVLLIFFGPLTSSSNALVGLVTTAPLVLVVSYSLYRSAKALVPLNFLSKLDSTPNL